MDGHSYRQEGNAIWGKPYRAAFYVWRHAPWVRSVFSRNALAKRVKTAGRDFLARFAGRDDLYNGEYYSYVDAEASRSAPVIVDSIVSQFAASRIVDVGCGTGALLAEFRSRGVAGVGLEYSQAALEICRKRQLEVYPFNIESHRPIELGGLDVAICFEVAEHLAAAFADPLVDLLVHLAPRVIFTAATPGQGGGADHVNEQPHEYWIAKFAERGYPLRQPLSEQWRRDWHQRNVAGFYAKNVMIFERASIT